MIWDLVCTLFLLGWLWAVYRQGKDRGEMAEQRTLFQTGAVTLHSGAVSDFKIDCDALMDADLETLARQAARTLPTFGAVEGVPTGGLRLAAAMRQHADPVDSQLLLIVDDVLTTGLSMEAQRAGRDAVGLVLFARGACPSWVRACFTLTLGEQSADRKALQRIMRVLGPDVPKNVDYTQPENAAGLVSEQQEALRILREAGIEYQPRKTVDRGE